MGEYYKWVNVDKKQYISPDCFDQNPRLFGAGGGPIFGALCALMEDEWKGDHIVYIGDYAPVPENPTDETLKRLHSECLLYRTNPDSYVVECFQDISGLFKESEEEVRSEIKWMVEHDDFEDNYYRVDKKDPYRGLFCRELVYSQYVINKTRKEYFDIDGPRKGDYPRNLLVILLGFGRDASRYKYSGLWLGEEIEVSDKRPAAEYRNIDTGADSILNRAHIRYLTSNH